MSELEEKIARALRAADAPGINPKALDWMPSEKWFDCARAALRAIENSGTHVVVPVEPTEAMIAATNSLWSDDGPYATYKAMLSARPRLTGGET